MITITGLRDHLRLDQPIRITGIRTEAGPQGNLSILCCHYPTLVGLSARSVAIVSRSGTKNNDVPITG